MGKSALALNIATNVSVKEKKSVLIFNMEMSKNIDDTPGINIMEIRSKARRVKEKTKDTNPLRAYSYRLSSTYRTCI